tara:strand:+ start:404 stop:559 length:156 start_codon:yes stop_codon:yes gene_type:complete
MSSVYSWSVVAWLGGLVMGVTSADGLTLISAAGSLLSLIAFFMIRNAEDAA